jgi:hypothetical protein
MQINYQDERITQYHKGRRLQRLMAVIGALEWAIMSNDSVDAYAMTSLPGFWYKVYVFTPDGVLRLNTVSERLVTARWAWAAIQGSQRNKHPLHQTTLEAVLRNWHRHGVWDSRPLGVPLLWAWAGAKGVAPHIVPETYTPITA